MKILGGTEIEDFVKRRAVPQATCSCNEVMKKVLPGDGLLVLLGLVEESRDSS